MINERRVVLFLTGTRADFGKIKPLIERLEQYDEFECHIFVTGMHMLARYGSTVNEVHKAGFTRVFPFINQDASVTSQMDLVLANTIQGLAHYVREFPPDLIVVHGDRVEALAGAIVGALNNVLVAHIEGGEVSGTVDELIRHAVSKLSHLHFVSNGEAHQRLIQMGEDDGSVFVIGSPDIDVMLSDRLPILQEVCGYYEIPFTDYAIFMYHPVVTELSALSTNIKAATEALRRNGGQFVIIYPNSDTGSDIILEAFDALRADPRFRIIPSMKFESFLTLLRNARAIVGNSSAGLREAPVYSVPTINIGTRQLNRFHHASILNVPDDTDAILDALDNLPPAGAPCMHFGRGESAQAFAWHLRSAAVWGTARQKQFQDLAPSAPVEELSLPA
jgi:UDP-N-acetylglucosamine 2-epimerase (hydrolysing)